MVTTVLLIFILLITLFLSIFRVYSISILLGAILIFIIGSFILIQQNHLLIASIFLIVYSGAILVFICISLLISPAIRPQNNQESINKSDLISKNFRFFFLFLCISFFIAFCGFYMISCVYPETNLVEFKLNLFHKNNLNPLDLVLNKFNYLIHINFNINTNTFIEYLKKNAGAELEYISITNPITLTFDITSFNLNNSISSNFKDNYILIIAVGIYLLLTLVCCLLLFSINHEKRVIKRQDSIDQILKRWV